MSDISQIEFEKTQQSSEVVSVTIRHDNVGEGDELIILEMDTSGPNVINVGSVNSSTEITIIEDDCELHNTQLLECTYLESRVSWVRIPPRAALFSFLWQKELS